MRNMPYSTIVQCHLHYIQIKQQYVLYSKATNILLNLSGLANQWSLASNLATLLVQTLNIARIVHCNLPMIAMVWLDMKKLHVNQNSMQEVVVSETISKRSIKDISATLWSYWYCIEVAGWRNCSCANTQGKREENQRGVVKNSTLLDRRWNFYVLHFRVFSLPYKMSAKGQINSHKKLSYTHICV